jgi:hypothetical protein
VTATDMDITKIDPTTKCPFLDLPHQIRLRIYRYSDLTVASTILIPWKWTHFDDAYNQGFHPLVYTCHQIYDEVFPLFYRENRFCVGSGRGILRLPAHALKEMRNILFLVNVPFYRPTNCCTSLLHNISYNLFKEKLPIQPNEIEEWKVAFERLFAYMEPNQLILHLICEEPSLMSTDRMLSGILYLFKQSLLLKSFSIRLGPKSEKLEKEAQEILEEAVPHLLTSNDAPFRYMDLPAELRLQILEHTDLVVPFAEVEYSALGECYSACNTARYPASDFRMVCTTIGRCYMECQGDDCPHHESLGCFCKLQHSVASSHPSCICWEPPTNLFLVSKQMNREASSVFFGRNRFIVGGSEFEGEDDGVVDLNAHIRWAIF